MCLQVKSLFVNRLNITLYSVLGSEIVLDAELSPSKALHAAKMISRFAETILKAQHHKLLEPVIVKSEALIVPLVGFVIKLYLCTSSKLCSIFKFTYMYSLNI